MKNGAHKVPIQSLIDHIKTAVDVDPWAKEMAEELLEEYVHTKEEYRRTKVEFIESYIKIGDNDYQWDDNHGELIRCRDCNYYDEENTNCIKRALIGIMPDWFCGDGKRG